MYLPFARKWRPQTFDEVVGQEHITTTLKNAISLERVVHAYLFTGPRGIGKTSTARILAKALNCQEGPTSTPCNHCISCHEISSGASLDCIEIDGASNRGIDEIRNLRENVKFSPTSGKFKVYIIDEVHMLTQEAFNALLKTLEEPPLHVKFVFATTQPHKVPPTILSRCQRFDFRRIPHQTIVSKLEKIAEEEKLQVSKDALFSIARASEGSLRDAESILDQLSAFSEGHIDTTSVTSVLRMVEQELLFEISQQVAKQDTIGALTVVNKIISEGKDISQFTSSLIEHFRNLMVAKVGKDLEKLIDLPPEQIEELFRHSQDFSLEDILYAIHVLSNAQVALKTAISARVILEMAMVKLTKRGRLASLEEILERLSDLESKIERADLTDDEPVTSADPLPQKKEAKSKPPHPTSEFTEEKASDNNDFVDQPTLAHINEIWPDFLSRLQTERMSTASYLIEGRPLGIERGVLTIGFPQKSTFHKETLEEGKNRALIEKTLGDILKVDIKVALVISKPSPEPSALVSEESGAQTEGAGLAGERVHDEPIIKSTLEMFGGRIVKEN